MESDTSVSLPPMMPASATGASASAMTRSSATSCRVVPSMVTSFSPCPVELARRTTIFDPESLSRSKACMGWPVTSRA